MTLLACVNCAARYARKSTIHHRLYGPCCPICLYPVDLTAEANARRKPTAPEPVPSGPKTSKASRLARRRRRLIEAAGCCAHCGADTDLTLDHIVPRSKGGSNRKSNLQVLCRPCNVAKGNRMPEEVAA